MSELKTLEKLVRAGITERDEGLEREKEGVKPNISAELKKEVDSLSDSEKQFLLAMTMESLRGSWNSPETRLSMVFYLSDSIEGLPKEFLDAIRHNAFLFNGHYIDGRIFRDGDRLHGLSGNLTYSITGDDRNSQKGFYGTYDEFWGIIGRNKKTMKKVYGILESTGDDLTWEDEFN